MGLSSEASTWTGIVVALAGVYTSLRAQDRRPNRGDELRLRAERDAARRALARERRERAAERAAHPVTAPVVPIAAPRSGRARHRVDTGAHPAQPQEEPWPTTSRPTSPTPSSTSSTAPTAPPRTPTPRAARLSPS